MAKGRFAITPGSGGFAHTRTDGGGAPGAAEHQGFVPMLDGTDTPQNEPVKLGTLTNRSGTITTGGTAQTLAAANANRRYLFIQNLSSSELWINFTTAAAQSQPSIRLDAGASFTMEGSFVSTELISIIGSTTGQAFSAKEG